MKPLYRLYMNLAIAAGFGSVIYTLFHFFGAPSMILLILIIPIMIAVFAESNMK